METEGKRGIPKKKTGGAATHESGSKSNTAAREIEIKKACQKVV